MVTTADSNTIATTPSKIAEIEDGGSALAKNKKRAGLARLQPRKNGRFARAQEVEAQVDRETWREPEQESTESDERQQDEDDEDDVEDVLIPGDFESIGTSSFPASFTNTPIESPFLHHEFDFPDIKVPSLNVNPQKLDAPSELSIPNTQKGLLPLPAHAFITSPQAPSTRPTPAASAVQQPRPMSRPFVMANLAQQPLSFSGNPNKEEPRAFWHRFLQTCVFGGVPKQERPEHFAVSLELDSPAYQWYHKLPLSTQLDFDALEKAFQAKYNTMAAPTAMPDDDALEYLAKTFPLPSARLLEYDNRPDEPARRRYRTWGRDVVAAAYKQHIEDRVIAAFKKTLPEVMREVLGQASTWDEFSTAIEGADEERMKIRIADIERLDKVERDMRELKAARAKTPARDPDIDELLRSLRELALQQQQQQQRIVAPPPHSPLPMQQRAQTTANPSAGVTGQEATDRRPTKEEWHARMEALKQNARDPYPDTQEGRRAYEADMTKWHARYGDATRADETRPYPLTPGTLSVGQGECFRCGRDWHGMNNPCPATAIPLAENQWRILADRIMRENDIKTSEIGRARRAARQAARSVHFVNASVLEDPDWQPGSSRTFSQNPFHYGYNNASDDAQEPYASSSSHNLAGGEGKA